MAKTAVREKPILFSSPMVRAILDGQKCVTRRIVKPQPFEVAPLDPQCPPMPGLIRFRESDPCLATFGDACPYGCPGDRLWVRETWNCLHPFSNEPLPPNPHPGVCVLAFAATEVERHREYGGKLNTAWRPSIFMPRWASRITLEIVSVRCERLQEITDADIRLEGFAYPAPPIEFTYLWDKLNGKTFPWASNPWVWRVEFRRIDNAITPTE